MIDRPRKSQSMAARIAGRTVLVLALVLCGAALSPVRSGPPVDSSIDSRVNAILARMTLEEKIDFIGGTDGFYVRAMPGLGVPRLRMADGPMGVRNFGPATAMAAGINLAATWDPALAERVGTQLGRDARAKGVNFLLGPGLNIYRAPLNGRNFEYFGEDPFLAGRIAVGYIDGVQSQGVSATAKHFAANNSEFDRHNIDSVVDERTLREIYLPAFEAAVKDAHVGAVMDSYNLVNGAHATQNEMLNTEILKNQWGFQGVLMSDWFATYDGVAAAKSGLDLEMPSGAFMNRATLLPAVRDGSLTVAAIDDKVRRILRLAIASHWLDRDQTDLAIPRYNLQGREAALDAAREGMVLLKNDANALPLDKHAIKSVAVIGPEAYPAVPVGGGSAGVRPFAAVSFLEGVANELGPGVRTYYSRGIPELGEFAQRTNFSTAASGGEPGLLAEYFSNEKLEGDPILRRNDAHVNFGAPVGGELGAVGASFPPGSGSSRWTGYYTPSSAGPHDFFVQTTGEAGGYYRLYVDDKLVLDDWNIAKALVDSATLSLEAGPHKIVLEHHGRPGFLGGRFRFGIVRHGDYVDPAAEKIAASSDAVIVAAGFDPESESEGADRTFQLPPGQDELIRKMAAANKKTIVVITSGGGVDMNAWIDRVPAVLEAWYSGQEGGTALAQILFGNVDPSGRLPATFERHWEDNPVHDSYYPAAGDGTRVVYKEGVFVGYRGYEHNGTKPLFPFGYGLSYTRFEYRNLSIRPVSGAGLKYEVSCDVTNTGKRDGADVAEIYVGEVHPAVPRPAKELKGFARVNLHPGETKKVSVALNARAFAYWDVNAHQWHVDPGDFAVLVGSSVDRIELKGTISLTPSAAAAGDAKP
ncbi:MAG TPA: glycoside hydrolase family 3 C-terminal domain-containing protein [Candidatus Baltobacteraceae bacterium]|nr:glycoside hydrolase family 3 C-terminal domain-containing protein [Candidatus Baltobacteraceae bacterium]